MHLQATQEHVSMSIVYVPCASGVVQGWAEIATGVLSRIISWFTVMVFHKRSTLLQNVDDTLGVFHTHVVAGVLGGALTGILAEPALYMFTLLTNHKFEGSLLWRSRWGAVP